MFSTRIPEVHVLLLGGNDLRAAIVYHDRLDPIVTLGWMHLAMAVARRSFFRLHDSGRMLVFSPSSYCSVLT